MLLDVSTRYNFTAVPINMPHAMTTQKTKTLGNSTIKPVFVA